MKSNITPLVVMGVQGSGKSTVGRNLALALGTSFLDADDLHSADARAKMAAGVALNDEDRLPWLTTVAEHIAAKTRLHESIVVACSALKRKYRDTMRLTVPSLLFVHLDGDPALIAARLEARTHEYMPAALLGSQLAALEPLGPDEAGTTVSLELSPTQIVESVLVELKPV